MSIKAANPIQDGQPAKARTMGPTVTEILKALRLFLLAILIIVIIPASSSASLGIEEEKKIGDEFYQRILQSGLINRDERLNRYLADIGARLLATGPASPFEFRFHILHSNAVNAFATPGGHIYVNLGLIQLAENEAQLASVIAHEIAHITGRHIASMIEKTQRLNIVTLAAAIAGALLGGGGDLSAAAASFALAAGATQNLRYSREHEEEADRIGFAILTAAGYSARAAVDFLRLMKRHEFFSTSVPTYLLTHPGIDDRIRYLDNLIHISNPGDGKTEIIGDFSRVRTMITLMGNDNARNQRIFLANLERNPNSVDDLYGLAVTRERLGFIDEALNIYSRALALAPDDQDVLRQKGISLFRSGRHGPSIDFLNRSYQFDYSNTQTLSHLARAYLSVGETQMAIDILRKAFLSGLPLDGDILFVLGSAYAKIGRPGESHYYFGRSFKAKNRIPAALHHFREAMGHLKKDSDLYNRVRRDLEDTQKLDRPARSKK